MQSTLRQSTTTETQVPAPPLRASLPTSTFMAGRSPLREYTPNKDTITLLLMAHSAEDAGKVIQVNVQAIMEAFDRFWSHSKRSHWRHKYKYS